MESETVPGVLHVVVGMSEDEWDAAMFAGRSDPDWDGLPVSCSPNWHGHPALGISGHGHGAPKDARRPHTHFPRIQWDFAPVFLD